MLAETYSFYFNYQTNSKGVFSSIKVITFALSWQKSSNKKVPIIGIKHIHKVPNPFMNDKKVI